MPHFPVKRKNCPIPFLATPHDTPFQLESAPMDLGQEGIRSFTFFINNRWARRTVLDRPATPSPRLLPLLLRRLLDSLQPLHHVVFAAAEVVVQLAVFLIQLLVHFHVRRDRLERFLFDAGHFLGGI